MLAPARLPLRYGFWNLRWGAPFGYPTPGFLRRRRPFCLPGPRGDRLAGLFAHQKNNTTRVFEFPWAFEQVRPRKGLRVLEIGGGLSGLQFALSRSGCRVTNVDPGVDPEGRDWGLGAGRFEQLNRAFGTDVVLIRKSLEEAELPPESFDVVLSVSVVEHLGTDVARGLIARAGRLLRPGGTIVLTVDLFPGLTPFTEAESNRFGTNVPVSSLLTDGLRLVSGERSELYGFPGFDARAILARSDELLVGRYFPAFAQCLVLERPA